uniref:Sema domain-containing protein n=1 Tax=Schistocephalus solidus TaxID=70667 RepID=A0A183SDB6_SCHSO
LKHYGYCPNHKPLNWPVSGSERSERLVAPSLMILEENVTGMAITRVSDNFTVLVIATDEGLLAKVCIRESLRTRDYFVSAHLFLVIATDEGLLAKYEVESSNRTRRLSTLRLTRRRKPLRGLTLDDSGLVAFAVSDDKLAIMQQVSRYVPYWTIHKLDTHMRILLCANHTIVYRSTARLKDFISLGTRKTSRLEFQVYRVELQDCASYRSCAACLAARDPYCGWCINKGLCSPKSHCLPPDDRELSSLGQDVALPPSSDLWLSYLSRPDLCPLIAHVSPSGVESPSVAYRRRVGSSKDPLEAARYRPNPVILQLSRLLADSLPLALRGPQKPRLLCSFRPAPASLKHLAKSWAASGDYVASEELKTALQLIVPGEVIEQTDASLLFNSDEVQCSSPDPARLPPLPDDEPSLQMIISLEMTTSSAWVHHSQSIEPHARKPFTEVQSLAAGLFSVYDCSRLRDCRSCSRSRFGCLWCLSEERCLSVTDVQYGVLCPDLPGDPYVTGHQSTCSLVQTGSGCSCPSFIIEPTYLSVASLAAFSITAYVSNLKAFATRFVCSEGCFGEHVNGIYDPENSTVTCQFAEIDFSKVILTANFSNLPEPGKWHPNLDAGMQHGIVKCPVELFWFSDRDRHGPPMGHPVVNRKASASGVAVCTPLQSVCTLIDIQLMGTLVRMLSGTSAYESRQWQRLRTVTVFYEADSPRLLDHISFFLAVEIFETSRMAQYCDSCLALPARFHAGWCLPTGLSSSGSCVTREKCLRRALPGTRWLQSSDTCLDPQILSVSPENATFDGLTTLIVRGVNFGSDLEKLILNLVGDTEVACRTSSDGFLPSRQFKCRLDEVPLSNAEKHLTARLKLTVVGVSSEVSSIPFHFLTPSVTGFIPSRGPIAGGTLIRVHGTNLNVGAAISVFLILNTPNTQSKTRCSVKLLTPQLLLCTTVGIQSAMSSREISDMEGIGIKSTLLLQHDATLTEFADYEFSFTPNPSCQFTQGHLCCVSPALQTPENPSALHRTLRSAPVISSSSPVQEDFVGDHSARNGSVFSTTVLRSERLALLEPRFVAVGIDVDDKDFADPVASSSQPSLAGSRLTVPYGFVLDNVASALVVGTLEVLPNPRVLPFPDDLRIEPFASTPDENEDELASISYANLGNSSIVTHSRDHHLLRLHGHFESLVDAPTLQSPEELSVRIGNSHECYVTAVTAEELRCDLSRQGLQEDEEYEVKIRFGQYLEARPGRIQFKQISTFGDRGRMGIIVGGVLVVVFVLLSFIIFVIWCRFHRLERNLEVKFQQRWAEQEKCVARAFKQDFMELQTHMVEFAQDLNKSSLPFRDYQTYCLFSLFPDYHNELQRPRGLNCGTDIAITPALRGALSNGVVTDMTATLANPTLGHPLFSSFHSLLFNKHFVFVFVRAIEDDERVSARDRSHVASLLSIILQSDMVYLTSIIFILISDLLQRCHSYGGDSRLLTAFRRSESVVAKMLSNWLTFLLFNFIKDQIGGQLFFLYRALLQQLNTGPQDVVTGNARYTLDTGTLLKTDFLSPQIVSCFYNFILQKECVLLVTDPEGLFNFGQEKLSVKVLLCDTITQAKAKILDAIYRNVPYSQQIKPQEVQLASHNIVCVMNDYDIKIRRDARLAATQGPPYPLNCLHDYGLTNNDVVAMVRLNAHMTATLQPYHVPARPVAGQGQYVRSREVLLLLVLQLVGSLFESVGRFSKWPVCSRVFASCGVVLFGMYNGKHSFGTVFDKLNPISHLRPAALRHDSGIHDSAPGRNLLKSHCHQNSSFDTSFSSAFGSTVRSCQPSTAAFINPSVGAPLNGGMVPIAETPLCYPVGISDSPDPHMWYHLEKPTPSSDSNHKQSVSYRSFDSRRRSKDICASSTSPAVYDDGYAQKPNCYCCAKTPASQTWRRRGHLSQLESGLPGVDAASLRRWLEADVSSLGEDFAGSSGRRRRVRRRKRRPRSTTSANRNDLLVSRDGQVESTLVDRQMTRLPCEVLLNRLLKTRVSSGGQEKRFVSCELIIFFCQMSVLQYMDNVVELIFGVQSSGPPACIKFLFDFLDKQAVHLRIRDPDIVHAWKSNCTAIVIMVSILFAYLSLHLRFWNQVLTNLDYIFDIPLARNTALESSFLSFSQAITYACSPVLDKVTKDSPFNKVLFAADIQRNWSRVKAYYEAIKNQSPLLEVEMNSLLLSHSEQHHNDFNVDWALYELFVRHMSRCSDKVSLPFWVLYFISSTLAAETANHEGSPPISRTADDFSLYAFPDAFVYDGLECHRANATSEWGPRRLLTSFEEVRRSFRLAGPNDVSCDGVCGFEDGSLCLSTPHLNGCCGSEDTFAPTQSPVVPGGYHKKCLRSSAPQSSSHCRGSGVGTATGIKCRPLLVPLERRELPPIPVTSSDEDLTHRTSQPQDTLTPAVAAATACNDLHHSTAMQFLPAHLDSNPFRNADLP